MTPSYPKTRLFVEPQSHPPFTAGQTLILTGEQAHYLLRVLRLKPGEPVALFNGRDGEWRATVTATGKKDVMLQAEHKLRDALPAPDVWVCFAPLKFGRIDYLAQKLTELGAAKLQPVLTQYTQAGRVNLKRLRANAVEAAEQCERVEVPQIGEPVALRHLLADWPQDRLLLYGDESGAGQPVERLLTSAGAEQGAQKRWAILIGPEGGFSEAERSLLQSIKQARGLSLGPRILRAETAAVTLLALTQARWGDWDTPPRFRQAAQQEE